jgi:hypothetical protein
VLKHLETFYDSKFQDRCPDNAISSFHTLPAGEQEAGAYLSFPFDTNRGAS